MLAHFLLLRSPVALANIIPLLQHAMLSHVAACYFQPQPSCRCGPTSTLCLPCRAAGHDVLLGLHREARASSSQAGHHGWVCPHAFWQAGVVTLVDGYVRDLPSWSLPVSNPSPAGFCRCTFALPNILHSIWIQQASPPLLSACCSWCLVPFCCGNACVQARTSVCTCGRLAPGSLLPRHSRCRRRCATALAGHPGAALGWACTPRCCWPQVRRQQQPAAAACVAPAWLLFFSSQPHAVPNPAHLFAGQACM